MNIGLILFLTIIVLTLADAVASLRTLTRWRRDRPTDRTDAAR